VFYCSSAAAAVHLAAQVEQQQGVKRLSQEHLDSRCWSYKMLSVFFFFQPWLGWITFWGFHGWCFPYHPTFENTYNPFKSQWKHHSTIRRTVLDSAAHNGLLILATASGLSGRRLDVGSTPPDPQLQGEVVARQRGDNRIRHHGDVVGSIEGEDQRGIRGGESGQSGGPVGSWRWRREEVHFTPDSTWERKREKQC